MKGKLSDDHPHLDMTADGKLVVTITITATGDDALWAANHLRKDTIVDVRLARRNDNARQPTN